MSAKDFFIEKSKTFFLDAGFEEKETKNPKKDRIEKIIYLLKDAKAGVFRGFDHYFMIIPKSGVKLKKEEIEEIHESFRKEVNAKIKTPRTFRFKVPNIVSVFISEENIDQDSIDYIRDIRRPWQGGEVHNVVYFDLSSMSLYMHNRTEYSINGVVNLKLKKVDPSNRSFYFIQEMCRYALGEE
jgi:hypothetical protein